MTARRARGRVTAVCAGDQSGTTRLPTRRRRRRRLVVYNYSQRATHQSIYACRRPTYTWAPGRQRGRRRGRDINNAAAAAARHPASEMT